MEIQVKSADRNLLLELGGELDHHGARSALRELEEALDAALPRKLVLDLSGVTFMDSSGKCSCWPAACWCGARPPRPGGCWRRRGSTVL